MKQPLTKFILIAFLIEGVMPEAHASDKEGEEAQGSPEGEEAEVKEPKTYPLKSKRKKRRKKKPKEKWVYEQGYRLLGTGTFGGVAEEKTNPDNLVYQLPSSSYLLEFRPEVTGSYQKDYKFVLRPRAFLQLDQRDQETPQNKEQEAKTEFFVNEAYFAVSPSSTWQIVLGTQNFQWGPAELASPSNSFFRDLGLDKTYFYETRGRAMVRVNYAPSSQLSMILLGEPTDNGAVRPAADRKFHKKTLAKIEYSDESQTNYIGVTATASEADRPEFGAYGNYEIATALTLYFDVLNRPGTRTFYPFFIPGVGAGFSQNLYDDDTRYSTALVGLRYVTERGWDMRLEGFKDEAAWTNEQRKQSALVLFAAPTEGNVRLFLAPGSFFPGQEFLYASVRIPDFGWKDSLTLSLRNLHSLTDSTEKLQVTVDTFLNDHLVASSGLTYSIGAKNGQLTQGYQWQAFLSGAWIF